MTETSVHRVVVSHLSRLLRKAAWDSSRSAADEVLWVARAHRSRHCRVHGQTGGHMLLLRAGSWRHRAPGLPACEVAKQGTIALFAVVSGDLTGSKLKLNCNAISGASGTVAVDYHC